MSGGGVASKRGRIERTKDFDNGAICCIGGAIEAVRLWAEDAIADGEELPTPRSVEVLRAGAEVAAAIAEGAALAIVPLLIDVGRPAKANLSLDAGLLAAIDEAAAARGLTRSAFLAGAAREKIESRG